MTGLPTTQPVLPEGQKKHIEFFSELLRSLHYPFRGRGLYIFICGTVVFWVMDGATSLLSGAMAIGPWAVLLLLCGYVCAYVFGIISSTADGEYEPPDWPDLTGSNIVDETFVPLVRVIGTVIMSFLPMVIYVAMAAWAKGRLLEYLTLQGSERGGIFDFSNSIPDGWAWPWCRNIAMGLFYFGLAYMPMALLVSVMFERVAAAHPVRVLRAIFKMPLQYAAVLAMLVAAVAGYQYMAEQVMHVPVLGSLICTGLVMYLTLLLPRVIGLLYAANSRRLDWFPEE